jgi:DoxX-like family
MRWAADVSDARIRTIGPLEVLGVLGPILPAALDVARRPSRRSAVGFALSMVGALATHLRPGETSRLAAPIILLAQALLVAVERVRPHSL